jgi:hypothetical protein
MNRLGEIEAKGVTDVNGYIDVWSTYYRDLAGASTGQILTPHTVSITYNNVVYSSVEEYRSCSKHDKKCRET